MKLTARRLSIASALALASLTGAATEGAPDARPPNIVFFLVDDLGWADVACNGSDFYETPNIDALSKAGVRFTNAYAACHVCSPTRASILTGKYPARLCMTDWLPGRRDFAFQDLRPPEIAQALADSERTLPETLRNHGYRTAIFGKWHLGEEPSGPRRHGFDVQVPSWNKGWPRAGYHAPFRLEGLSDKPGDYLTDRLTDEAVKFVETHRTRPFFLYLSHFSVHDPIQGRHDLVEKYRRKLAQLPAGGKPLRHPAFVLEGNPDDAEPPTSDELDAWIERPSHQEYRVLPRRTVKIKQRQDNVLFAAMVEATDESLGRIMKKLRELGLERETIVVFFSDNGGMAAANFGNPRRVVSPKQLDKAYSTSNLPLRGAKGWLYEGGIRVPLIVQWRGKIKAGAVCESPVISTDFYPTLLELAQLPRLPDQHLDGKSFAAALRGEAFDRGSIFWHFPHYSNHGMQSPGGAIRQGRFKLLEYFERGTVQLFDLSTDIGESNDLSKERPELAMELLRELRTWRRSVGAREMTRK